MNKVTLQGFALLSSFLITWFVLSQINWIELFNLEASSDKIEQKLGEQLWEVYSRGADEVTNDTIIQSMDSLVHSICSANGIDVDKIKLRVLEKDEVNAFAMPDGYLVIYTGLIKEVDKQEELTGVICHELAHIQLNHVMKKLAKEVGISVLVSATTGSSGSGVAEIAKMLSSTAFDRDQERQADLKAAEYMENAHINPEHLANFLYQMSLDQGEYVQYFTWISTHPDSKERATAIVDQYDTKTIDNQPILREKTWSQVKGIVE